MRLILTDRALRVAVPDDGKTAYVDLTTRKIARCVGCFGCWTRTPGRCVIRDDATRIYPLIARSDTLLYVSRIRYGGYDTVMKTMLERAIPVQQAFIRVVDGETHHEQRPSCRSGRRSSPTGPRRPTSRSSSGSWSPETPGT